MSMINGGGIFVDLSENILRGCSNTYTFLNNIFYNKDSNYTKYSPPHITYQLLYIILTNYIYGLRIFR